MGLISLTNRGFINIMDRNSCEILIECSKIETELQIAFEKRIQITITFSGAFMVNSKSNRRLINLSDNEKTTFKLMKMAFPVGTMLIG